MCSRFRSYAARDFTDRDVAQTPGVVIINEALARLHWPTGNPLADYLIIGREVFESCFEGFNFRCDSRALPAQGDVLR
jgi:hypothetical protein